MDTFQSPGMSRRRLLALAGAGSAGLLAGPVFGQGGAGLACVVTPEQTEGPYFVDERLLRSNIRSDPADGSVSAGLPLRLSIRIAAFAKGGCTPLAGALVDLWQCDAQGHYSDTADPGFRTKGRKFLRGYQVSDAYGGVEFTTIYPGWYPGRAVHIHFKIRTDAKAGPVREFTSQFYFDDALTDKVHALESYARRGLRRTKNDGDSLFRDGGGRLILPVAVGLGTGSATFDVALRIA